MKQIITITTSILIFSLSLGFLFIDPIQTELSQKIEADTPYLLDLYKHIHSHPEVSLKEVKTAKRLATELRSIGFEVSENVGGTGIVGMLRNGAGPTILVRTDLDALPMSEKTGLSYASEAKTQTASGIETGVMHSCGHDMHMTVWTGTARALKKMSDKWKGTLMMVGQPAEEIGAGAIAMLKDGLYERFAVPDYGVALHMNPELEAGKVGYCPGYALAKVDAVTIKVFGEGGHGAAPHTTIDPIVMASMIVMDLQTIVSRNINPIDGAVITVGSFNGGTKSNIIPDEATLQLTVRSYKPEVRNKLIEGIKRIAKGAAVQMGLPEDKYPEVIVQNFNTPAVYNDLELQDKMKTSFEKAIGEKNVMQVSPEMFGEDFSNYGNTAEKVPTVLYWLGAVPQEKYDKAKAEESKLPGLHSPFFYPDPDKAIETGVATMSTAIMDLMNGD